VRAAPSVTPIILHAPSVVAAQNLRSEVIRDLQNPQLIDGGTPLLPHSRIVQEPSGYFASSVGGPMRLDAAIFNVRAIVSQPHEEGRIHFLGPVLAIAATAVRVAWASGTRPRLGAHG